MWLLLLLPEVLLLVVLCIGVVVFAEKQSWAASKLLDEKVLVTIQEVPRSKLGTTWLVVYSYLTVLLLEIPRRMLARVFLRDSEILSAWVDGRRRMTVSVENVRMGEDMDIRSYREIADNGSDGDLSGALSDTASQLLGSYALLLGQLQLTAMANAEFPLAAFGSLHVSNEMRMEVSASEFGEISLSDNVAVRATVEKLRYHKKGTLFDVYGEILLNDRLLWSCRTVALSPTRLPVTLFPETEGEKGQSDTREVVSGIERALGESESEENEREGEIFGGQTASDARQEFTLQLPLDIGKRYALLCQDYNPIHLHPLTAKLMGFPSCIAHGMCVFAQALSVCEKEVADNNSVALSFPSSAQCRVHFIRPVILPTAVVVKYRIFDGPRHDSGNSGTSFAITAKSPKGTLFLAATVQYTE